MASTRPIKKYRVGGVEIAIWENQVRDKNGEPAMMRSATFERRYRDENGDWKSSKSLREADLPKAILGLSKAYEFMALKEPDRDNGDERPSEVRD